MPLPTTAAEQLIILALYALAAGIAYHGANVPHSPDGFSS